MTERRDIARFITRTSGADFFRKAENGRGNFDYCVSALTAAFIRTNYGVDSVHASNEGRNPPLNLSLYSYQVVMEGESGLIAALGGKGRLD